MSQMWANLGSTLSTHCFVLVLFGRPGVAARGRIVARSSVFQQEGRHIATCRPKRKVGGSGGLLLLDDAHELVECRCAALWAFVATTVARMVVVMLMAVAVEARVARTATSAPARRCAAASTASTEPCVLAREAAAVAAGVRGRGPGASTQLEVVMVVLRSSKMSRVLLLPWSLYAAVVELGLLDVVRGIGGQCVHVHARSISTQSCT